MSHGEHLWILTFEIRLVEQNIGCWFVFLGSKRNNVLGSVDWAVVILVLWCWIVKTDAIKWPWQCISYIKWLVWLQHADWSGNLFAFHSLSFTQRCVCVSLSCSITFRPISHTNFYGMNEWAIHSFIASTDNMKTAVRNQWANLHRAESRAAAMFYMTTASLMLSL